MALPGSIYLFHRSISDRNEQLEENSGLPQTRRIGKATVLSGLAIMQIAGAVLCTMSRGGLIAMLTVLGSYLFVGAPGRLAQRLVIGAVSLLLLFVVSIGYLKNFGDSDRFHQRVTGLVDGQALADDSRPQHWRDSIATAVQFPLLGTGEGTYSSSYKLLDSQHL